MEQVYLPATMQAQAVELMKEHKIYGVLKVHVRSSVDIFPIFHNKIEREENL